MQSHSFFPKAGDINSWIFLFNLEQFNARIVLFWHELCQNSFSGYWDVVSFMVYAILVTANGGHLRMPIAKESKSFMQ